MNIQFKKIVFSVIETIVDHVAPFLFRAFALALGAFLIYMCASTYFPSFAADFNRASTQDQVALVGGSIISLVVGMFVFFGTLFSSKEEFMRAINM